ncbi:MAG: hypothetical protein HC861_08570 [Rhodospirillaceae bacterium]|nr:hypothetical protein [Rhodospirillaceae bacterium]
MFALALLLVSAAAWSQAVTAWSEPILPFTQFTLDNGLTVIVREDHKLPIVSVEVVYQAGSRNDPPGKSGLAHLFEHLLFYGSEHHPQNFLVTMQRLGGTNVNGGTGPDLTTVYQTVPVSQLDAVLWLESDRMGYLLPALTQKTLEEQIQLIRNEINMGRDEPGGDVRYRISAGVFPPDHPYHKEPVGDPQELGSITLNDARSFFRTYYAPGNAAVVIAGDITPSEALAKVNRYFGGLPAGPRPDRMTTWVPELSHDKRERIFDAASPKLFLTWPMPSFGTIDDVHLRLAGSILMDGDASRVRRRLAAAGLDASDLSWFAGANAMAGAFQISTGAASPTELRTLERLIRDEIAALAAKEPAREELERAQRSRILTLRQLAQRTAGSNGQADLLAHTWGLGDRMPVCWTPTCSRCSRRHPGTLRPHPALARSCRPRPGPGTDGAISAHVNRCGPEPDATTHGIQAGCLPQDARHDLAERPEDASCAMGGRPRHCRLADRARRCERRPGRQEGTGTADRVAPERGRRHDERGGDCRHDGAAGCQRSGHDRSRHHHVDPQRSTGADEGSARSSRHDGGGTDVSGRRGRPRAEQAEP